MAALEPHELQVVQELEELKDKAFKLDKFISTNSAYDLMNDTDKALLVVQLSAMHTYIEILSARIVRFGK